MGVSATGRWTFGRRRAFLLVVGAIVACIGLLIFTWRALHPYAVGVAQPIPISHKIHAGVRQISCLFCHDGADRSTNAGMPEVRKCLLCHNAIITDFAPIQDLHGYFDRGEPVPWKRVYNLPDYARFSHEMHLAAGVDCGQCHGDVRNMDRIIQAMPMEMGFCVDCHKANNARTACPTCHY